MYYWKNSKNGSQKKFQFILRFQNHFSKHWMKFYLNKSSLLNKPIQFHFQICSNLNSFYAYHQSDQYFYIFIDPKFYLTCRGIIFVTIIVWFHKNHHQIITLIKYNPTNFKPLPKLVYTLKYPNFLILCYCCE